jgi:outer membrane protein OmpA-like peptidoglycan-associated protein
MGFEEGMRVLASSLADQVERSSLENKVNSIASGKIRIKKIVIDPFIDVQSGYPVKANDRIARIMSTEMKNRFDIGGEMEPDTLEAAEYVLNGMVTIEGDRKDIHKVFSTVFEKSTGKVLASAAVRIRGLDTTPKEIYKDSPVFLKGEDYKHQAESVRKNPEETVNKEYQDSLTAKSMQVKGDNLYEHKEYNKSLTYYNQAAKLRKGDQPNILNGQFTNLMAQGNYQAAEEVYGRLLRASLKETGEIASTISFAPGQKEPLASKANHHNIYMKEIASFVVSHPDCRLKIVGHSSKTGSAAYNDRLSKERAECIQKQMKKFASGIIQQSTTDGRGFRECLVCKGKDDFTNLVDRRVEFIFSNCIQDNAGNDSNNIVVETKSKGKTESVEGKGNSPLQGRGKIAIKCDNGQTVMVNNFFPKGTSKDGEEVELISNEKMNIVFRHGSVRDPATGEIKPSDPFFQIAIGGRNLKEIQKNQKEAEAYMLKILGIDKTDACKLPVMIGAPKFMTGRYDYTDEDFSFCPGGKLIQRMKFNK